MVLENIKIIFKKKYMKNIFKNISILLLCAVVFAIYINSNYIIMLTKTDLNGEIYGIIDDSLTTEIENVTYINYDNSNRKNESHGEKLCRFANDNYKNFEIYYYNAEINGQISSENIIYGLDELKDRGVNKINISLSSKIYSDGLQNWISEHKDIKIFASYNNKINTYDYPAMYEGVVASGKYNDVIKFKECDVKYNSMNIIGINSLKKYSGNSFLSLVSMFKNEQY